MAILSESTQLILTDIGVALFVIGLFCFGIAITLCINDFPKTALFSLIIGISFLVIAFAFQREPHRKIKVTIPDDFSATALYDKYSINDRDGDIWILTDKEPIKTQEE